MKRKRLIGLALTIILFLVARLSLEHQLQLLQHTKSFHHDRSFG